MHNKELERLQEVDRFLKLKISKEEELREIAEYASEICGTPVALITLIDADTQYIKIGVGTDLKKMARAQAFCNLVIGQDDLIVIPDTSKDPRVVDNPLRKGKFNIQFYAGAPLRTKDGINLGSLCVIDHQPKELSSVQKRILSILSQQVIHILEFDYSLEILKNQYLDAKKNEIKLRSLFESSPSCQLLLDRDLKILFFNKALSDFMLANHRQQIKIGDHVTEFVGADFMDSFILNFNRALAGEHIMLEHSLKHGENEVWWQFHYNPAYDSMGGIIGISYSATDISELKMSQEETMERNRALASIALVQSHEFRRPVASIIGLVGLIKAIDCKLIHDELAMLELAAQELDTTIKTIVKQASVKKE